MTNEKQLTVADLIEMLNKASMEAYNSRDGRMPSLNITAPDGKKYFVNRMKSGEGFEWKLGPQKISRVNA